MKYRKMTKPLSKSVSRNQYRQIWSSLERMTSIWTYNTVTRREFIKTAGMAAAAIGVASVGLAGRAKANPAPLNADMVVVYPTGEAALDYLYPNPMYHR